MDHLIEAHRKLIKLEKGDVLLDTVPYVPSLLTSRSMYIFH